MSSVMLFLILIVSMISVLERAVALNNGDLRLVSGNTTRGWVEIYYESRWYTISDQFLIYDVSKIICRQLGLPFTQAITIKDVNRPLDDIGVLVTTAFCDGNEARLEDCRQFSWSFPLYYTHNNDIGVHCLGEYVRTGDLRLVNGIDHRRGRLEIFMGKAWESFCSIGFGVTEATVACRQLGLLNSSNVVILKDAYYGQGNFGDGPYIVGCTGDEDRIEACPSLYRSFSSFNYDELLCSHSKDVGICCPSITDGCPESVVGSGSVVGSIVGSIIVVIVVLLIIGCCCYCCCKKKKGKQQYTTVVQNPPPQPVATGQQASSTQAGTAPPPVYYHGSTPGYPTVNIGQPNTQSYPVQYPPTGQTIAAPDSTTYPSQPYPYPSGQVPPPAVAAGSTPYPSQPKPYPFGQVPPPAGAYPAPSPQQGYNPTAATNQYPPQPTVSYPPQGSDMEQSYPTKGDRDHPLPTSGEIASAPPMDLTSGQEEIPSAPPPAYEHLIG